MTRVRVAAAVLAATVLASACTSDRIAGTGHFAASGPAASATSATDPQPPQAWTSKLDAVETPHAAAGGFVLQVLGARKQFELVSVAAADGRVRWRAPASPSRIDPVDGLRSLTVQDGRTVLWLAPGRVYRDGDVSLAAADSATGIRRWAYGGGRLRVRSSPQLCRGNRDVCLLAYLNGSSEGHMVVLDAVSGDVMSDEPGFDGEVRTVAPDLYSAGGELGVVDDQGRSLWHRPATALYGDAKVSPDYGDSIQLADGRYIGSVNRVDAAGAHTTRKVQDWVATAGFDAATGRTLWTRPHSAVDCGQLRFDIAHPVVCDQTGRVEGSDDDSVSGLDVTLEGIDAATGKARWKIHAGSVQALYGEGNDVIRTGVTAYTLRTADGLVALDLDRGPLRAHPVESGWCDGYKTLTPAQQVDGTGPGPYGAEYWYPCTISAGYRGRPDRAAAFAGATVAGIFAYNDSDGLLRASRTG